MRNKDNSRETADRLIHIRVTPTMYDALRTEMSINGYKEMSSYIRSLLEGRSGGWGHKAALDKGAITAVEHLSTEIRKIGSLYNQFVAAYNKAVLMKGPDGQPRVSTKETQRNQMGLMDLTMEMTRNLHLLLDKVGIPHDAITRTSGKTSVSDNGNNSPSRGRVIIPKF